MLFALSKFILPNPSHCTPGMSIVGVVARLRIIYYISVHIRSLSSLVPVLRGQITGWWQKENSCFLQLWRRRPHPFFFFSRPKDKFYYI